MKINLKPKMKAKAYLYRVNLNYAICFEEKLWKLKVLIDSNIN